MCHQLDLFPYLRLVRIVGVGELKALLAIFAFVAVALMTSLLANLDYIGATALGTFYLYRGYISVLNTRYELLPFGIPSFLDSKMLFYYSP